MKRSQKSKVEKYSIQQDSEVYSTPIYADSVESAVSLFIKRKYPVVKKMKPLCFETIKTYENDFYLVVTIRGWSMEASLDQKWNCYCELTYDKYSHARILKDVTVGAYLKYS